MRIDPKAIIGLVNIQDYGYTLDLNSDAGFLIIKDSRGKLVVELIEDSDKILFLSRNYFFWGKEMKSIDVIEEGKIVLVSLLNCNGTEMVISIDSN